MYIVYLHWGHLLGKIKCYLAYSTITEEYGFRVCKALLDQPHPSHAPRYRQSQHERTNRPMRSMFTETGGEMGMALPPKFDQCPWLPISELDHVGYPTCESPCFLRSIDPFATGQTDLLPSRDL